MSEPEKPLPRPSIVRGRVGVDVVITGIEAHPLTDLYHTLFAASWPRLLIGMGLAFAAINAVFGAAYHLCGDCINAQDPDSFLEAFSFSVQTMATIGYGALAPRTPFAYMLSNIEAFLGLLGTAMATGLMFARFSKPQARVRFSKVAVVHSRDGQPCLALRIANERGNRMVEANLRALVLKDTVTAEGHHLRRLVDLPLERSTNPIFAMTWLVVHRITPDSPLAQAQPGDLGDGVRAIILVLNGIDETFNQTVVSQHSYQPDEVLFGHRFVDMIGTTDDGRMQVHHDRIDQTVPVG